jgi:hypothetical protein
MPVESARLLRGHANGDLVLDFADTIAVRRPRFGAVKAYDPQRQGRERYVGAIPNTRAQREVAVAAFWLQRNISEFYLVWGDSSPALALVVLRDSHDEKGENRRRTRPGNNSAKDACDTPAHVSGPLSRALSRAP